MNKWYIYIDGEGDWPINYKGCSESEAREVYLKCSGRKRLPKGSKIWLKGKKIKKHKFVEFNIKIKKHLADKLYEHSEDKTWFNMIINEALEDYFQIKD